MAYDIYDKDFGPWTLKIIKNLADDLSKWSAYNGDKASDKIIYLQALIEDILKEIGEEN